MTDFLTRDSDRIPVPEPEYRIHPGEFLKCEFLDEYGISPDALAKHIGVPSHVIEHLCAGHGAINADLALRLERALKMPAQFWLDAQHAYDDNRELERLRANGKIAAIKQVPALIN